MALMFSRLAHNFIKNGYYPTDEQTLSGILSRLKPAEKSAIRLIDPCCGEGTALAEIQHHLGKEEHVVTDSYGIEIDKERAWHAKSILDQVIHGDLNDCWVGTRQFSLLFFNPPYGNLVADSTGYNQSQQGKARLEKSFYQLTKHYLQFGGIGIIIIPHYVLDKPFSHWIARHYQNVQIYRAAEERFKQVVIMGQRCHATNADKKLQQQLEAVGSGDLVPDIITTNTNQDEQLVFTVPATINSKVKFMRVNIEPEQLADEINRQPVLWSNFNHLFLNGEQQKRQPLRRLSEWHMALMLAAGHVNGIVTGNDGKILLIKGDTHKSKKVSISKIESDDEILETRTATDTFVPVIRGINFTPGESYGQVVKIS